MDYYKKVVMSWEAKTKFEQLVLSQPSIKTRLISSVTIFAIIFVFSTSGWAQPTQKRAQPPIGDSLFENSKLYFKVKLESGIGVIDLSKLKGNKGMAGIKKLFGRFGVDKLERPFLIADDQNLDNIYRVHFDYRKGKVDEFINGLKKFDFIAYAEKVPVMKVFDIPYFPNDPDNLLCQPAFSTGCLQYSLPLVSAYDAFEIYRQSNYPKVDIAIVDNAISITHPDFAGNLIIVPGCNIVGGGNGPNDPNPPSNAWDHGTHCAGIAGASTGNNLGIASLGYNNRIMPIRAGSTPVNISHGFDGIMFAVMHGAEVVSCSWGGYLHSASDQAVIDYAYSHGVTIIASAGNDNISLPVYPAAYDHVISVASSNQNDEKSTFSNFGSWIDLCAPGTDIWSTSLDNSNNPNYELKSGTSMAGPLVAALAGLLKSKNPSYTPDQIEACLKQTAKNIDGLNIGYAGLLGAGRINAYDAIICSGSCGAPITLSAITASPSSASYSVGSQVSFSTTATNATQTNWVVSNNSTIIHTFSGSVLNYSFTMPGVYNISAIATNSNAYCTQKNQITVFVTNINDLTFSKIATYEKISDIVESRTGGYLVASIRYSSPNFKVVQKLSKNGTVLWKHSISNFSPPPLATFSSLERGYFTIAEGDDGSVILAIPTFSGGQHFLSLVKLDGTNGVIVWKKAMYPPTGWGFAMPIIIKRDNSGGFIIAGSGKAYTDYFLLKIDGANGAIQWNRFYNTSGKFIIKGFTQTVDNGFLVYGITKEWTGVTYEYCATRLKDDGTVIWSNIYRALGVSTSYDEEFTGIVDAVELDDCKIMLAARTAAFPDPGDIVSSSHIFIIDRTGTVISSKELPNYTILGLASNAHGIYKMVAALRARGGLYALDLDAEANCTKFGKLEDPANFYVTINMPETNVFKGEKLIFTQDNGLAFFSESGVMPSTRSALFKLNSDNFSNCSGFPNPVSISAKSYFKTPATVTSSSLAITESIPACTLQAVSSTLNSTCNLTAPCGNNTSFYLKRSVLKVNEPLEILNTSNGNLGNSFIWIVDGVQQATPPISFSVPGIHSIKLFADLDNPPCHFQLEKKVFVSDYPNCNDGNPCTVNDVYDASCNCAGTIQDSDSDGVCDANDRCPGFNDNTDTDADGVPDGCDFCSAASPFAIQTQTCFGGLRVEYPGNIAAVTGGRLITGKTNTDGLASNGSLKGVWDSWVIKTDNNNSILWSKYFGNTCDDNSLNTIGQNIVEVSDGYVLGGTGYGICGAPGANEGFWLVKLDFSGNKLWEKYYGGSWSDNCNVMIKGQTGFLLAGSVYSNDGQVSGNHGEVDAWVINTDDNGVVIWKACMGGTGLDIFTSAQLTNDGYLLWGHTTSNNGDVSGNNGGQDFWLVKLDFNGNVSWKKTIGGNGNDESSVIKMAPNGDIFVIGTTTSTNGIFTTQHGNKDFWVARLDLYGTILWSKCYGGSANDIGRDLLVVPGGITIVVTGASSSSDKDVSNHIGSYDIWIASIDANSGQLQCNNSYGDYSYEEGKSILYNASDYSYYILCQSNSSNFACSYGQVDMWLVKVH